jgi:gas vesicle protein
MTYNQYSDPYTQPVEWLIGTIKRKPEALLVMAAGAALLMRSGSTSGRWSAPGRTQHWDSDRRLHGDGRLREGADQYAARATDTVNRATRTAGEYASAASETARSYASAATDLASDAGDAIASQASRVADRALSFADQTQAAVRSGAGDVMREQPLAVALLGVAAGAALALVFPSSRIEERTLRPARDAVVNSAREMGENVVRAATKAGEQFKQDAVERGLTPEGVKEMVKGAADTFKSRVSGGSDEKPQSSSPSTPTASSGGRPI